MRELKLSGVVAAFAIVFASASGCAVQSGDGMDSAGTSDEALVTCSDYDPVDYDIYVAPFLTTPPSPPPVPYSGTCLTQAYAYPNPAPLKSVGPYVPWADIPGLAHTAGARCLAKNAQALCHGKVPPARTNSKWACSDGPHFMAAVYCPGATQAQLVQMANQCKTGAEAFVKAPNYANPDPTNSAWLAFDPVGSNPHGPKQ